MVSGSWDRTLKVWKVTFDQVLSLYINRKYTHPYLAIAQKIEMCDDSMVW